MMIITELGIWLIAYSSIFGVIQLIRIKEVLDNLNTSKGKRKN